jgi:hypothetical protein
MILAALTRPAYAASEHFAIRAESIAAAISDMGTQVLPEQVTFLTDVVAARSEPRLRVRSMEKSNDHRMTIRMECENSEECLPFYVGLRLSASNESLLAASVARIQPRANLVNNGYSKTVTVRKGSTATLLLDSDRVHIRFPVVCLENGVPGQKIRVTGVDRRQVYMAEVIDGTLLKGRL